MWDPICVLLMIRINHEHRRMMARNGQSCLDAYLDRVHLMLWPRLKVRPHRDEAHPRLHRSARACARSLRAGTYPRMHAWRAEDWIGRTVSRRRQAILVNIGGLRFMPKL